MCRHRCWLLDGVAILQRDATLLPCVPVRHETVVGDWLILTSMSKRQFTGRVVIEGNLLVTDGLHHLCVLLRGWQKW